MFIQFDSNFIHSYTYFLSFQINTYSSNFLFTAMAEIEKEILTPTSVDEPFLGTLDFILLAVLLAGGVWWLLKRNKKEEKPVTRSYSIQ